MSNINIINILWWRKWIFILTVVLSFSVAIYTSTLIEPLYSARVTVRVSTVANPLDNPNIFYADRLIDTYIIIAQSQHLLEALINDLDLTDDLTKLRSRITIEAVNSTEIIYIIVEHEEPELAASIGNALAEQLLIQNSDFLSDDTQQRTSDIIFDQITNLQDEIENLTLDRGRLDRSDLETEQIDGLISSRQDLYNNLLRQYNELLIQESLNQNRVSIIANATVPSNPVSPNRTLIALISLVVGAGVGVSLAFLFEYVQPRIYSLQQLNNIQGIKSFATPFVRNISIDRLDKKSSVKEIYRQLWAQLFLIRRDFALRHRTMMFVSLRQNEGKKSTLLNFALVTSRLNLKTIILDMELKSPTLHKYLRARNERGIVNLINDDLSINTVVQSTAFTNLHFMAMGQSNDFMWNDIFIEQINTIINSLKDEYEVILINASYLNISNDAFLLTDFVSDTILVLRQGYTLEEDIISIHSKFVERADKSPIVIMNK